MTSRLHMSAALATALILVSGCWEEEANISDGLAETTVEQGELSPQVARTTDEIARLEGEQAVEQVEENAVIVAPEAAAREAVNENELAELEEQRLSRNAPGDAPPVERLADTDIPTVAEPGTDDPLAPEVTGPAVRTERQASDVGAASQEASEMAYGAARLGESPAEAAQEQAREAADAEGVVGAPAGDVALAAALSPGTFDMETARRAIEQSDLERIEQQVLITGIESAQDEPAILRMILAQARVELGLE